MQEINTKIQRIPRYIRFIVIVLTVLYFPLPLAILLLWAIYPEWSMRVKLFITIGALLLIAAQLLGN